MICAISLQTTKFLRSDLPTDDRSQAWLVEIAWSLSDMEGNESDFMFRRVRLPEDASVHPGAEAVHGISTRKARRGGASQRWALFGLLEALSEASVAITYSAFDHAVAESLIHRIAGREVDTWLRLLNRPGLQWVDVIVPATQACKIDGKREDGSYRFPRLDEAASIICDLAPREGPHRAYDNLSRTRSVFLELRRRNMIETSGDKAA